jgi:hypothetical protein
MAGETQMHHRCGLFFERARRGGNNSYAFRVVPPQIEVNASKGAAASRWLSRSSASGTAEVCRSRRVDKVYILDKGYMGRYTPNMPTTKELLNVRDTARILGVHENTIRNWEERGIIRALHLPGSGYRRFVAQDVERLRTEMFEQLAPATEGPVVNPGRKRTGRLIFGDATE